MASDQHTDAPVHHVHAFDVAVATDSVLKLAAASHFSERWFADAREQSRLPGQDARRREIVFGVCLAETYLYEWVVHEVFRDDWDGALRYFPPGTRRGVVEKWRKVPKALTADGWLKAEPNLGGPHGTDWRKLVDLRDELVHAVVSRPRVRRGDNVTPMTTPNVELEAIPPGWALSVVVERITRLHAAAGSPPPVWLTL